jgi:hypothetical protein
MKAPTHANSEEVSVVVCAMRGHNIVMFNEVNKPTQKFMCTLCGLSLDEIRGGETKNRVTD